MKRWRTRNEMHIKSLGIKEKEHVMMTIKRKVDKREEKKEEDSNTVTDIIKEFSSCNITGYKV